MLHGLILGRGVEKGMGDVALVVLDLSCLTFFLARHFLCLSLALILHSTPLSQTLTFYQDEHFYISPHGCSQNFIRQHHSFLCF